MSWRGGWSVVSVLRGRIGGWPSQATLVVALSVGLALVERLSFADAVGLCSLCG
jgi:hypothetical protein